MREHERFEVRFVDAVRRVYVLHTSDRKYADACLIADHAFMLCGGDWIVRDGQTGNILYDSRKISRAQSPAMMGPRSDGGS